MFQFKGKDWRNIIRIYKYPLFVRDISSKEIENANSKLRLLDVYQKIVEMATSLNETVKTQEKIVKYTELINQLNTMYKVKNKLRKGWVVE